MLKNYFTIAVRSLQRHKAYTFINVTGLAVGVACCLLILLFVRQEQSYDRFHENADHIYRVYQEGNYGGQHRPFAATSLRMAPALKASFPEIEHAVRLYPETGVVKVDAQRFEEDLLLVDASFFEVFTFPLERGDPARALAHPNGIVLSHEAARKFFGEADPMGRTLSIRLSGTFFDFTVQGVAAPIPTASSIRFTMLLPIEKLADVDHPRFQNPSWRSLRPVTYVQLAASTRGADLEAKLPAFVEDHLPEQRTYRLQPLTEIHLGPRVLSSLAATSNPAYSYILSLIAFFILLIACINFTTLTLGRSASRVREVGVRKVVGAFRSQLVKQFWGEALVISTCSLVLGLVLVDVFLPAFNGLVDKKLSLNVDLALVLSLGGLVLLISLLAGGYPAIYLSRFNPVEVLKGRIVGRGKHRFTQGLVVVQFALSIFLVTCMLLMSNQLDLFQEQELGYEQEQVIRIRTEYGNSLEGRPLLERYRAVLADDSAILGLTGSMYELGRLDEAKNRFPIFAGADSVPGYAINVTPEFVETLGLDLVQGRNFSEDRTTDITSAVLVNETLVEAFGWDEPLGQTVSKSISFTDATVIGVVKDFHYESLHQPIEPLALYVGSPIWTVYARIAPTEIGASLASLERAWRQVAPDLPFEYVFLDQEIERQYEAEQRWALLIRLASALAIFIACLGLLGLANLASTRRRKEIGVRKVLGASVEQIVLLLTKHVALLAVLALGLAAPVAYFA
ncbi:MAG: ABC transporter permease, partial [Bacteroidetes bacterium]|nr:ABC transporter permease [Bacteroidota bacterium]